MSKILGIDLGTTNSAMAVMEGGEPTIIINAEGDRTTPSVIAFRAGGERVVGRSAKNQAITNPENTISSIKRLIGRGYGETSQERANVNYKVVAGKDGRCNVEVDGKDYTPEEISAMVLQKLKVDAEKYTGGPIKQAVITVPAYFNDSQRQATKDAGRIAGLEVLRIINEPTAAALAYGFGANRNEKIAVFDFGGGTFDITILEVNNNIFSVLATAGDSFLGGDDIDAAIVQFIIYDIEQTYNVQMMLDSEMMIILLTEAERIKIELSKEEKVSVLVKNLIPYKDETYLDYERTFDRRLLEQIVDPIISRCFDICKTAMADSHLSVTDLDAVIMVGGSSKMPRVQQRVSEFFQQPPYFGIESVLVISMGASIMGHTLSAGYSETAPTLLDVVPLSLGVGSVGDYIEVLVDKNEPLPLERKEIFTNATDNAENVKIAIYQGGGQSKKQAHLMGELTLADIRRARRGELKIEVTFEIDTNGVLNVSAVDLDTGRMQKITLNILGLEQGA